MAKAAGKSETKERTAEVFDIDAKRKRFREGKEAIAYQSLALFETAEAVRLNEPDLFEAFLLDVGISADDVPLFREFSALTKEQKEILKTSYVSPEFILTILGADGFNRGRILQGLKAGAVRSAKAAEAIPEFERNGHEYTPDEFLHNGRVTLAAAARSAAERLKSKAQHLHRLLSQHEYEHDHEKQTEIVRLAKDCLVQFEAIFGTDFPTIENWYYVEQQSRSRSYLAQVHFALEQMAESRFDNLILQSGQHSWSPLESLGFLAGILPKASSFGEKRDARFVSKLTAIELCAGSGGLLLGLEAARFSMVGIHESDNFHAEMLSNNRPDLEPIIQVNDLRNERNRTNLGATLPSGTVDLIAGALPTEPFAANGAGEDDPRALLGAAGDLVDKVKPRAFFFEVHENFETRRHTEFRLDLYRKLDKLGYGYDVIPLNAKDYSVPQDRKHYFLVGLKKEFWPKFAAPTSTGTTNLREALANIAFPELSSYALAPQKEKALLPDDRSEAQRGYDEWAAKWFADYGDNLALDIRDLRSNKTVAVPGKQGESKEDGEKRRRKRPNGKLADGKVPDGETGNVPGQLPDETMREAWIRRGFTHDLRKRGTKVDDYSKEKMVPITIEVLKRLQGLPDDWSLEGDSPATQEKQLINLTPPRLAFAIARSIRAALVGEELAPAQRIGSGKEEEPKRRSGFMLPHADDPLRKAAAWAREMQIEMEDRGYYLSDKGWVIDDRGYDIDQPAPPADPAHNLLLRRADEYLRCERYLEDRGD